MRDHCRLTLVGDDRLVVVGAADGPLSIDGGASLNVVDRRSGEVLGSTAFEDAPSTYYLPLQASGEMVIAVDGLDAAYGWDVSGDTPTMAWDIEFGGNPGGVATTDSGFAVNLQPSGQQASRPPHGRRR